MKDQQRFAICVSNHGYPASLELHKVYRVSPLDSDTPDEIRVVDESGEDYLYPTAYFLPVELPLESTAVLQRSYAGE